MVENLFNLGLCLKQVMHQSKVRSVFIIFLIFLPLQYALVGVLGHYQVGEHWPAFVFPGFKNVFDGTEGISLETPVLTATLADSSQKQIPVFELLSQMPYSHHRAVMTRRFNPEAIGQLDAETRGWLFDRITAMTGEQEPLYLDVYWESIIYQLVEGEVTTRSHTVSHNTIHFDEEV